MEISDPVELGRIVIDLTMTEADTLTSVSVTEGMSVLNVVGLLRLAEDSVLREEFNVIGRGDDDD